MPGVEIVPARPERGVGRGRGGDRRLPLPEARPDVASGATEGLHVGHEVDRLRPGGRPPVRAGGEQVARTRHAAVVRQRPGIVQVGVLPVVAAPVSLEPQVGADARRPLRVGRPRQREFPGGQRAGEERVAAAAVLAAVDRFPGFLGGCREERGRLARARRPGGRSGAAVVAAGKESRGQGERGDATRHGARRAEPHSSGRGPRSPSRRRLRRTTTKTSPSTMSEREASMKKMLKATIYKVCMQIFLVIKTKQLSILKMLLKRVFLMISFLDSIMNLL